MTTRTLLLLLAAGVVLASARPVAFAASADFYVSPQGKDAWSGRLAAPNRARTDGPFGSVRRAQEAVRHLREAQSDRGRPVVVQLRGGIYAMDSPLVLEPIDSGSAASPTIFAAFANERPVLSGGVRLTGWKRDARGWWHVTLPDVAAGQWSFQQLFVNGSRRYRPRLPKTGYYTIEDALPPSPAAQNKGADQFRFREGEIHPEWHDLGNVEVLGFQTWTMARLRIRSVDSANRIVSFTGTTRGLEAYSSLPKGNRYLVENVREALSEPGEFYLDRGTGELTYIPLAGEIPASTTVIAPRLDILMEFRGNPAEKQWVHHVEFRRITLAHSNWTTPPEGNAYPQAEVNLGGVITGTGARDCVFDRCRVEHTGVYAMDFGTGCKHISVRGCRLSDLGAGGVKLGLTSAPQDDELVASHNVVENCVIAHGGRLHPAAVGVWIGHSHHNRIAGNEIADLYYTGVSVGWSWGYGRSLAHHNILERNHIHDLGQGVLSDMGGIYTLGLSPGTELRGNRIHDVDSFDYGGWAIYPDEGSTDIVIEDNVAFRTKSAPFHQHYGKENVVRNNIFAFGRGAQVMRTREEEHISFTMEQNIIYWKEGVLLGSNWTNGKFKLDRNIYWNAGGQLFNFAGMSLNDWRKKGQDQNSIIADPKFVDADQGDFRLQPGSPAERIGFRPIDPAISAPPPNHEPLDPPAFPVVKN